VLKKRSEDLNGRRWHNNDERLLTGVIRCGRCHAHVFGAGAKKKGKYFPYYVCSKRMNTKECDQDYVRADYLEAAVIQDVKALFRDDAFVTRVWEEANRRLAAERPDVEKEITSAESQVSALRSRLDRYFEAFESGSLKPEVCGEKTEDLNRQVLALEAELRKLRERRQQLELPALDRAAVAALIDDFEQVMAAGTNPQKKHLLHQVVKKVLVHDRLTVEVWYGLPYPSRLADSHIWLPKQDSNLHPAVNSSSENDGPSSSRRLGGNRKEQVGRWLEGKRRRRVGDRCAHELGRFRSSEGPALPVPLGARRPLRVRRAAIGRPAMELGAGLPRSAPIDRVAGSQATNCDLNPGV
jgi:hypothetical protein